ncbi:MAG: triose-phosphate isomerase [Proteobacteria bacterium]|nr:triose-phosphate isomerase [Pseudomonadota bacterium]
MRQILVAGNWKMNGDSATNAELVADILAAVPVSDNVRLLLCPPFPYISAVAAQIAGSKVSLGAQNVSEHSGGAHTGEVAAAMLRDIGCSYAIVGHSERRTLYGETSAQVANKFQAVLDVGMTPILCIGETLQEREAGRTNAVTEEQLDAVLGTSGIAAFGSAVIAYEPVWAIGTGKTASPEQAQDVHRHIRAVLEKQDRAVAATVQILYGGSMKGDNAAGLIAMQDIDGGLVGGASLQAADFLAIAGAAAQN